MSKDAFIRRRDALRRRLGDELALFHNGRPLLQNQTSSGLRFRGNSHCLYFAGRLPPDSLLLVGGDGAILGAPLRTSEQAAWEGPGETLASLAERTGCERVVSREELVELARAVAPRVMVVPPLHLEIRRELEMLIGRPLGDDADRRLLEAISEVRLSHDADALSEIRSACEVTVEMYRAAFTTTAPGRREYEVAAALEAAARSRGFGLAYLPIVTTHGEVLHNEDHSNELRESDLLLVDAGAESPAGWASDVTRTWPVAGRFSPEQAAVYDVVLEAFHAAIAAVRTGAEQWDVHFAAARAVADGLRDLGVLEGDVDSLVERHAHSLFFTHGIGHLIGLDVHDMEDLGDVAGYERGRSRDTRFGTRFLRLHRPLRQDMVISIEPGIYFVPSILADERIVGPLRDVLRFDAIEKLRTVRGIRIEDTVRVTNAGAESLTATIPKSRGEIEVALEQAGG